MGRFSRSTGWLGTNPELSFGINRNIYVHPQRICHPCRVSKLGNFMAMGNDETCSMFNPRNGRMIRTPNGLNCQPERIQTAPQNSSVFSSFSNPNPHTYYIYIYIQLYTYIHTYIHTGRTGVLPGKVRFDGAGSVSCEILHVVRLPTWMAKISPGIFDSILLMFTHFYLLLHVYSFLLIIINNNIIIIKETLKNP